MEGLPDYAGRMSVTLRRVSEQPACRRGRADGPRRVDSEQDYILDGNPGRYCEEGAGARILVAHRLGSDLSRVGLATGVFSHACQAVS